MRFLKCLVCLVLSSALTATSGTAQSSVAVGGRVSTLGIGGEVTLRVTPSIAVRGMYNKLSFTRTEDIEGIGYDINPDLNNGGALLDLHPFRNAFRLTGGVVFNGNRVLLVAVPTQPIEIGNVTYLPSQVGRLDGEITVNDLSPYFGLGFAGNGRLSLTFDVGIALHGTPQASLIGTTPLTGVERTIFDAEIVREQGDVQVAIDNESLAKLFPVIALGFKIRL